jgi:hypothetical protein
MKTDGSINNIYAITWIELNDRSDQYDRNEEITDKPGKRERQESWND